MLHALLGIHEERRLQGQDARRRHRAGLPKENDLSTDARIPVTLLRTNACSPLGTNAIRGNIWDNFSSDTYKTLPSVGKITVQDPFTAERWQFQMPDGGLGFTRVPSLVGVWSTAPFLLNNRLGPFSTDPSVNSRMSVFNASIEQLLWPEKRQKEPGFDGYIARTTERSAVYVPYRNIPVELSSLIHGFHLPFLNKLFDRDGGLTIGPIPKGFPINLASNVQPAADLPLFSARHAWRTTPLSWSWSNRSQPLYPRWTRRLTTRRCSNGASSSAGRC